MAKWTNFGPSTHSPMANTNLEFGGNRLYFGQDMEDSVFSMLALAKIFVNNFRNYCDRKTVLITFGQTGV